MKEFSSFFVMARLSELIVRVQKKYLEHTWKIYLLNLKTANQKLGSAVNSKLDKIVSLALEVLLLFIGNGNLHLNNFLSEPIHSFSASWYVVPRQD